MRQIAAYISQRKLQRIREEVALSDRLFRKLAHVMAYTVQHPKAAQSIIDIVNADLASELPSTPEDNEDPYAYIDAGNMDHVKKFTKEGGDSILAQGLKGKGA